MSVRLPVLDSRLIVPVLSVSLSEF